MALFLATADRQRLISQLRVALHLNGCVKAVLIHVKNMPLHVFTSKHLCFKFRTFVLFVKWQLLPVITSLPFLTDTWYTIFCIGTHNL